ncbi:hypothetical protein [Fulvivirga lutimaris]|uniref:hypothetical protein n=1 Tax=Fulvivirga lutimaris TaxID=1819566 RepID=UPI0012BC1F66|nr:hypothetical protein [Fulvivirga lutimaris]MTI38011.1 hypothetical protein [Fulvivirga lutimaris]
MKQAILITFSILHWFSVTGQNQVEMKWKINANDTLIYTTVMEQIDSSYFEADFGGVFSAIIDSTSDEHANKAKTMMKEINNAIGKTQYAVRLLKPKANLINIEMFTIDEKQPINLSDTQDQKETEMIKSFQQMIKGVVLRGSIFDNGTIHSFWIKRAQKNLIAMLFELPGKKVRVGDTWSLTTNLIGNDQNFVCDSSYYKNEVKLVDVKEINGDQIAVLKYDLKEYVNGVFNMPNMFGQGGSKPTIMSFGFKGIAEFSIDKGRWVSYDGVMFGDATGVMNTKQRVKYALFEQDNN